MSSNSVTFVTGVGVEGVKWGNQVNLYKVYFSYDKESKTYQVAAKIKQFGAVNHGIVFQQTTHVIDSVKFAGKELPDLTIIQAEKLLSKIQTQVTALGPDRFVKWIAPNTLNILMPADL